MPPAYRVYHDNPINEFLYQGYGTITLIMQAGVQINLLKQSQVTRTNKNFV